MYTSQNYDIRSHNFDKVSRNIDIHVSKIRHKITQFWHSFSQHRYTCLMIALACIYVSNIVWSYVVISRHVYRYCEKLCQNCVILCRTFETCISMLRETLSKLCDLMSYFRDMYIDVARNFVKIANNIDYILDFGIVWWECKLSHFFRLRGRTWILS
jgi:hypothetical protein